MDTFKTLFALVLVTAYIQSAVAGGKKACSCSRLPNVTTIGIDITHWYHQADAGRCEETCDHDPADKKAISEMESDNSSSCNPTEVTIRTYPLMGDSKYRAVIEECGYQQTSGGCTRQALFKNFFKGTSYSRRHDIGVCLGSCGVSGHECKAIDRKMVAIKGPNGDGELTVPVIEKCGCVNPICHRVAFREIFKRKSGNAWVQEEKDVGMCVGTGCPRICTYCFFGSKSCDRYCMVFQQGACIATRYTTEYVRTGDLKKKEIRTITQCGCR